MTVLPNNILKCLSKQDRAKMGKAGKTADECEQAIVAKSERELQNQIANYLRLKGIWFSRNRMDKKPTNQRGTPDYLLAIHRHRECSCAMDCQCKPVYAPVAIEVKFEKGKLSYEQEDVKNQMLACGWEYYEVRSLQEVIAILAL